MLELARELIELELRRLELMALEELIELDEVCTDDETDDTDWLDDRLALETVFIDELVVI